MSLSPTADAFIKSDIPVLADYAIDDVLKALNTEKKRRFDINEKAKKRRYEEALVKIFPNIQSDGILEVIGVDKWSDSGNIRMSFTPKFTLTDLTENGRDAPYLVELSVQWRHGKHEYWELRVDLNGIKNCTSYSSLWYCYRNGGGARNSTNKDKLSPYECNKGPCNHYLPLQFNSVSFINFLLTNYVDFYDSFMGEIEKF